MTTNQYLHLRVLLTAAQREAEDDGVRRHLGRALSSVELAMERVRGGDAEFAATWTEGAT